MRGLGLLMFMAVAGCTPGGGTPDMTAKDLSFSFPMGCTSGAKDGDETDVDCGGSCAPCGTGKMCKRGTDCDSGSCTNQVCDGPSCSDGKKNGVETDVDCGGANCAKCPDGKACNLGTDCQSGTCNNNVCKPSPCSNGAKDGAETDVDCGGGTCGPCADGKACNVGGDCTSGTCNNNVCKGAASCMDGAKNGSETDIDCGGGMCPKCADGKTCAANADCANGSCVAMRCTPVPKQLQFAAEVLYPATQLREPLQVDLDANKRPEIVYESGSDVFVMLNDGAGGLKQPVRYDANMILAGRLSAGDVDGDGNVDLLSGGAAQQNFVLPGKGDGTLRAAQAFSSFGGADHYYVEWIDLDADGTRELVYSSYSNQSHSFYYGHFKLDGSLQYLGQLNASIEGGYASVHFMDLNLDGKIDVFASQGTKGVRFFLSKGNFAFDSLLYSDNMMLDSMYSLAADFNNDRFPDLVSATAGGSVSIALANGAGWFKASSVIGTGAEGGLESADFDRDGKVDLVTVDRPNNKMLVWRGNGDGTFKAPMALPVDASPNWAYTADMNGDGLPDIVTAHMGMNPKVGVILNTSK